MTSQTSRRNIPSVPVDHTHEAEHRRFLAVGINNALDGKINSTGTVTLAQSATSTTLTDYRIGANSIILFMPTTANAAAGMDALYVSARSDGSATLTHDSTADSDRTFGYVVLG